MYKPIRSCSTKYPILILPMLCSDGRKNEIANEATIFVCRPPWKHHTLEVKQKGRQNCLFERRFIDWFTK